ncbi:MAG: helix-turn-helix domain-containing protein [Stackebrandtia sp.]
MPYPLKPLDPSKSPRDWFGAELRHWRQTRRLTQTQLGEQVHASGDLIGKIEKAQRTCPQHLAVALDDALETGGVFARARRLVAAETDNRGTQADNRTDDATTPALGRMLESSPFSVEGFPPPMDRRQFLAAGSGWAALLAVDSGGPKTRIVKQGAPALADLARAVISYELPRSTNEASTNSLPAQVAAIKRGYQACRYRDVVARLPPLLADLRGFVASCTGAQRQHAHTLTADACQVAASVLLKHDETSLAAVAADRSMSAASRSEDPVMAGSAARSVVHTLARAGHHDGAAAFAASQAGRLDGCESTPAVRSVQGALLLRGAAAAAQAGDRDNAARMLDAAAEAAAHLFYGDNHRWTGFDGVNVNLHRVHTAVTLGDAGHAVALARRIDVDTVKLVERRACLAIDVAVAYAQWGKHDKALDALHLAETTAPEETRTRSAVRNVVNVIAQAGPPSLRPHVRAFAARLTEPA